MVTCSCGDFPSFPGTELTTLCEHNANDAATGIPLDMFRYSLLAVRMAQDCSLKPRFVQFSSANNHIYEKNREDILTIISREPKADVPWIDFNPSKNLFNLDPEQDIVLHNYRPHEAVKLTVAV